METSLCGGDNVDSPKEDVKETQESILNFWIKYKIKLIFGFKILKLGLETLGLNVISYKLQRSSFGLF